MDKKEIAREHLKKNIMHSIIFRIDYQGIIDINPFIGQFAKVFNDRFKKYETTFHNRVDLSINSYEEISRSLSVPVKEIEQQIIHRFSENTFGNDQLVFDISKYFTVLSINCINYQSIDPYLTFFSDFCNFIHKENPFLQIKRVGLRKIGTNLYENLSEVFEDFESKYLDFDFAENNFDSVKRELRDVLQTSENISIEYKRGFEKGFLQKQDGTITPMYQVTLDFDGILKEKEIIDMKFNEKSKDILTLINNNYLFTLFKMSVTKKFLDKNSDHG